MKKLLSIVAPLFASLFMAGSLFGQIQAPVVRNSLTTNSHFAADVSIPAGNVPIWDATKLRWTNGAPSSATATNAIGNSAGKGTNTSIEGLTLPLLTASRALAIDASNNVTNSVTTLAELAFSSGVTGGIQTNLDARVSEDHGLATNTLATNFVVLGRMYGSNGVTWVGTAPMTNNASVITNAGDMLIGGALTVWSPSEFHNSMTVFGDFAATNIFAYSNETIFGTGIVSWVRFQGGQVTNRIAYLDGLTNLNFLSLGANLSIANGVLTATAGAGGPFNISQFSSTAAGTNIKAFAAFTNPIVYSVLFVTNDANVAAGVEAFTLDPHAGTFNMGPASRMNFTDFGGTAGFKFDALRGFIPNNDQSNGLPGTEWMGGYFQKLNVNTNAFLGSATITNILTLLSNHVQQVKFTGGQASNSFLFLNEGTNVVGGTFGSGLTFASGVLTAAGSSATTNLSFTMVMANGSGSILGLDANRFLVADGTFWISNKNVSLPAAGFGVDEAQGRGTGGAKYAADGIVHGGGSAGFTIVSDTAAIGSGSGGYTFQKNAFLPVTHNTEAIGDFTLRFTTNWSMVMDVFTARFRSNAYFFGGSDPILMDNVISNSFKVVSGGSGATVGTVYGTNPVTTAIVTHNTNIVFSGLKDHTKIRLYLTNSGTFTASLPFNSNDYVMHPNQFFVLAQNGITVVDVEKDGTKTNVWDWGRSLGLHAGAGILFTTNSAIDELNIAVVGAAAQFAGGGGGGDPLTVVSNASFTNITLVGTTVLIPGLDSSAFDIASQGRFYISDSVLGNNILIFDEAAGLYAPTATGSTNGLATFPWIREYVIDSFVRSNVFAQKVIATNELDTALLKLKNTTDNGYASFSNPSGWIPTNNFSFKLTNVQAGQYLKIASAVVSSGIAQIDLTNDVLTSSPPPTIKTNDIVVNTRYTNTTAGLTYVQCSMTLNAGVTDIAQAVLLIDQDANGTFDTWITNRTGSGVATADSILIGGWVTNGGIYMITNQSTGSATATINPNSSQVVSGIIGGGVSGSGPTTSNNIPFTAYSMITGSPTTNIVIDASLGTLFRVLLTNSASGLLITNGVDGQELSVELYQDGVGNRTVTHVPNTGGAFTNNWQFGEDITSPITLTTNQYKKDLLKLRYEVTSLATNTSRSNWMVIGALHKYANP